MREYVENISKSEIMELYLKGNSIRSISKIMNCSYPCAHKVLKKNNLIKEKDKYIRQTDDYFFETNSEKSCYWAGFIAADGNVSKCNGSSKIRIELSNKDYLHLENFKKCLNLNQSVKNRTRITKDKKHNYSYIQFCSSKIMKDLKDNFNIVEKKSLVLEPPSLIDEFFIKDFIRGYFDGDGTVYVSNKKISVQFLGTKSFLEWIKKNIKENCKNTLNPSVLKKSGSNIFCLQFSGKQVRDILCWLYNNSSKDARLERKYEKYIQYLESNIK